ncbi:hypothetical protein HXX76_008175 [Chlamydomonas incerta]|uniref:Uncharacterized protein n=1 Tax=Chlamydomonas incerta TaxID=51695 RepID=A0A835T0Z5_CHLIN|nr:hypothetical protein HXX76_008175 [Chlamydomonas incerta]|eukprot:KAG2433818.1 hypothetical protein HXX76_008175 [Chlamydomonas incerta]
MNLRSTHSVSSACYTRKLPGLVHRHGHSHLPRGLLKAPAALSVGLDGLEAGTASEVVNALKGPTLSQMVGYAQSVLQVLGDAWVSAVSPLAVFGPDRWGLSLLFYAAVGLLAYNLIVAAPKQ